MNTDSSSTAVVNVDLCGQNITQLCFDADDATTDERTVACHVTTLHAEQNSIHDIRGLGDVFDHLVELYLSNNNLGSHMSSHPSAVHGVSGEGNMETIARSWSWCDATPPWLRALPPTLQVLDLSHNQLYCLMQCTCGAGRVRAGDEGHARPDWPSLARYTGACDSPKVAEHEGRNATCRALLVRRYMQHACPFNVALFFDRHRLPQLRQLVLSDNMFATSLSESYAMERLWTDAEEQLGDEVRLSDMWQCAVVSLDLSNNRAVASASSFLTPTWHTPAEPTTACYALRTLRLAGCAVADLAAMSSLALSIPTLNALTLHPTPLSRSLLDASEDVLAGFLQTLILGAPSCRAENALTLLTEGPLCITDKLLELDSVLVIPHHLPRRSDDDNTLTALATSVYAAVLQALIPHLTTLEDGAVLVETCLKQLRHAVQSTLLTTVSPSVSEAEVESRRSSLAICHGDGNCHSVSFATPTLTSGDNTRDGLKVIAAEVTPTLRARVAVDETPSAKTSPTTRQDGVSFITHIGRRGEEAVGAADGMCGTRVRSRLLFSPNPDESDEQNSGTVNATGGVHGAPIVEEMAPIAASYITARVDDSDEGLDAECSRLQHELAQSQRRQFVLRRKVTELQQQLTGYRTQIAERRRELEHRRTLRDELRRRVESHKQRIARRKKDVAYGLLATEQSERTRREVAVLRELHAREKELERKERALRKQIALSGIFALPDRARPATQGTDAQSPITHLPRSERLRQEAVRKRLAQMESADPLAYSPTRFRGSPPTTTADATQMTLRRAPPPQPAAVVESSVTKRATSVVRLPTGSSRLSTSSVTEMAEQGAMEECSLSELLLSTAVDVRGRDEPRSRDDDGGSRNSSQELQAKLPLTSSIAANSSPGQSEPLSDELIKACPRLQLQSVTEGERDVVCSATADAPKPVHRMLFTSF